MLPRMPQPLTALRQRYPFALEHVHDVVAIRDRGDIRPGEVAANVFDHEDGLRLIVSRERMPDGHVVLHVSASFGPDCQLADELRLLATGGMPAGDILRLFIDSIPGRFRELSGHEGPLTFVGLTSGTIPHFHRRES